MERQNLEVVNQVLNDVGQFIIGTVGQHSLDWDYACFISAKSGVISNGRFYLFHKSQVVGFKSSQLILVLDKLFSDYKKALNLKEDNPDVTIKYVIKNSDLRSDIKIDKNLSELWSSPQIESSDSLFKDLVGDIL